MMLKIVFNLVRSWTYLIHLCLTQVALKVKHQYQIVLALSLVRHSILSSQVLRGMYHVVVEDRTS